MIRFQIYISIFKTRSKINIAPLFAKYDNNNISTGLFKIMSEF